MMSEKKIHIGNQHAKDSPFFTIVTASLNSGSTIEQTIRSIKNQTFQGFEHVIIDGGSKDGTKEILKEFEGSSDISWISEPDCGIADALNKGLCMAKGRYVLVIQADDMLLMPDILEKVYRLLNNEDIDIISFPVILDHPVKGKILRHPIRRFWWNHFKFIFPHQGCFVHKRTFDKIGGFRNEFKICMDYDFFYRALAYKCSVKFAKFPVALMGGTGVGSILKFVYRRLEEERLVQVRNEQNKGWIIAQFIFRSLYIPYKKYRISHAGGSKPKK